jgi:electron transport complex protein RnfA
MVFIIYSALAMNILLQCGLGINDIAAAKSLNKKTALVKLGIIFAVVMLLWVIFAKIISSLISGIFVYVLLFPVSFIVYNAIEYLIFHYVIKKDAKGESSIGFSGGITASSLFICLNITDTFLEAAAVSFGSAAGIFLVFLVLTEIRQRASLEAVPRFLRGKPLTIISMGLLSLIFSSASVLLFKMIGG